jgi:CubicO group peptidase (beta-lactamase class C family)/acetyl esterase/lipase
MDFIKVALLVGVALLTALFLNFQSNKQKDANPTMGAINASAPVAKELKEYLTRLVAFGFSGTALVAKDGKILVQEGFGLANREKNIPMRADSIITVGSITKQFTAAAILKLEMQGKLNVKDPITKYLKDIPEDKQSITLHHLLTHTAGFPEAIGDDNDPIERDAFVILAMKTPLRSKPGERYAYSNVGYSLLGIIIELITAESYETFLNRELFTPAEMHETGDLLPKWERSRIAHGYREGEDRGTLLERPWTKTGPGWHLRANGGILSTVGDMYKWHLALEGEKILSKATKEKLFTPHVAEGPEGDSFYGYGWVITTSRRGTKLIMHNGGDGVFAADFLRYVEDKAVILILTNEAEIKATQVSSELARILFGANYLLPPDVATLDEKTLSRFSGTYELGSGSQLAVSVKNNGLFVSAITADALLILLTGQEPTPNESTNALNEKVVQIVEAVSKGDLKPLHDAFGGRISLEELASIEQEMWQSWRAHFGEFKNIQALGTVMSTDGPGMLTYAKLEFDRGSVYLRYRWEEGHLVGIRPLDGLPGLNFLPTTETEFVSFNLRDQKVLRLRFQSGEVNKIPTTLILQTEGGKIEAHRVLSLQQSAAINIQSNVVYANAEGQELRLDIYKPNASSALPAIILLPTTDNNKNDRTLMIPWANFFAQHGYASFTVEHRPYPFNRGPAFPAQVHDAKCAVRWVRAHAKELNIQPEKIGVVGFSAGGWLAGLLGVTGSAEGLEGSCGDTNVSSHVQAVVTYYAPLDLAKFPEIAGGQFDAGSILLGKPCLPNKVEDPALCAKASPVNYVSSDDSPFLLVHGTRDESVSIQHAEMMRDALKKAGVAVEFVAVEGAGHIWGIDSPFEALVQKSLLPFLEKYLKTP